jgi:hypothetical protein
MLELFLGAELKTVKGKGSMLVGKANRGLKDDAMSSTTRIHADKMCDFIHQSLDDDHVGLKMWEVIADELEKRTFSSSSEIKTKKLRRDNKLKERILGKYALTDILHTATVNLATTEFGDANDQALPIGMLNFFKVFQLALRVWDVVTRKCLEAKKGHLTGKLQFTTGTKLLEEVASEIDSLVKSRASHGR